MNQHHEKDDFPPISAYRKSYSRLMKHLGSYHIITLYQYILDFSWRDKSKQVNTSITQTSRTQIDK